MFLKVSHCSRAKQWQKNVQKRALHVQIVSLQIRPIAVFFHRFRSLV